MKLNIILIMLFFSLLSFISFTSGVARDHIRPVYIISISGKVDPAMASFVKRAVAKANNENTKTIIFEIDSFGGRVDSALDIVNTLLTIDKNKSVSYVKTKAISAGSLIALASGSLYMKNGTTIGDCAPITYSKEGVKEMGEKFQSPLRAKFRALAKRNGFIQVLAESMVSKDKEIIRSKKGGKFYYFDREEFDELEQKVKEEYTSFKTVVKKGELLTMDDSEAKDLSFSKKSVADLKDLLKLLNIDINDIVKINKTWSEIIAGHLISIAPILMMIGLAGIYLEIKSPGFGIAGIIGLTCLFLAFSGQYMAGLANYTEMLIIFTGILCLIIEIFFLPGFGIAGITGLVLIFSGMVLALQDFVLPDPKLPWEMDIFFHNIVSAMAVSVFSFLLSILAFRYILPHLSFAGQRPFLNANLKNSHAHSFESRGIQTGDRGIAISKLRPSGKAEFNKNRIDVISQNEFIDKGEAVEVIESTKNKIVVQKIEV